MREADEIIASLPETERIENRLMEAVRQHYMQARRSKCAPWESGAEFLLVETSKWLTEEYNWRVSGNYWIGLRYNVTDSVWHWADGNYLHLRL
ncbi:hypothetical protein JD844_029097 [Phrynosoma platyrhinos]|uniref:C-type lectin receptor n=1 Tax=Phrynosoma platyrhinos TaxID=52577 RepID=A0ABQ7SIS3_PHRPL|nr:hypothetical protein JD844_029097 [Phrynosoma platyrhinos]